MLIQIPSSKGVQPYSCPFRNTLQPLISLRVLTSRSILGVSQPLAFYLLLFCFVSFGGQEFVSILLFADRLVI